MHIRFRLSLLFCLILSASLCSGQGTYVPPKVQGKHVKELQNALLECASGYSDRAIETIQQIIRLYPSWTEPRQELSRIYFESGKKQKAIDELEATLRIDTLSQLRQLYTLGRIYEVTGEPEQALACYRKVIQLGIHQQGLVQQATASMQALEEKRALWNETYQVEWIPFSSDINTPNHESLGRWTLDGRRMVFTRLLQNQEDIFIAEIDSVTGAWRIEDFPFNSPQREGAHAISPDGKMLIFTGCLRPDGLGSCDLYLSEFRNGQWTDPVNMGPAFNTISWDGQPCFGLDGLSLYFSSSRPGGYGGRDIWYAHQISAGKWSAPINAGPVINTSDNEESPFIHFDGQTLYFMRDGPKGLGGYDLYISRRALDGSWQTPENLGAPINSGSDEGALSVHPDGTRAVITRETPDQRNDLFEFVLPERFRSTPLQALHVTITDSHSGKPLRARIEVFEVDRQDTIRLSQWSDAEGRTSVALQRNKDYGLMVALENYILYSTSLQADTSSSRHLDILLTPLEGEGEKVIVLQNIFFAFGSAALLPASEPELQKLLRTLRSHTTMQLEIRGHTDNIGDEMSNQTLSEARAKSVMDYLVSRGIDSTRLTSTGFGETHPVSDNTTEEGRRKNRRTEFRIIQL